MLVKVLCVAVASMVVVAPYAEATIACPPVWENMVPCLNYVKYGGSLPADCCNALRGINNDSKSTADRQRACNCIKELVSYPDLKNPNNFLGLPDKCGVNFPYKFSNMTDCSNFQLLYKYRVQDQELTESILETTDPDPKQRPPEDIKIILKEPSTTWKK